MNRGPDLSLLILFHTPNRPKLGVMRFQRKWALPRMGEAALHTALQEPKHARAAFLVSKTMA